MPRWAVVLIVLWCSVRVTSPALSQEFGAEPLADEPSVSEPFGPAIVIEDIEVVGNSSTATRLILRALPVKAGDTLQAGDPRLSQARFKILALGFFREVALKLSKGSARGQVVLTVVVIERGTLTLERLYFGTTRASPWWAGLDLSDRNIHGTGLGVGGAFLYAGQGDVDQADSQWAGQLRIIDPSAFGLPWGWHATLQHVDSSEPYRTAGEFDSADPVYFRALNYRRTGGKVGATYNVTPLSRVAFDYRLEWVDGDVPAAPQRYTVSGPVAIDLHLEDGKSRVGTFSFGFDADTRANPVLPYNGHRVAVVGELGGEFLGGSYNYARAFAQFGKWWALGSVDHVFSVHLGAAFVSGDVPLFDRLYVGDLNKFLTPRELGLALSTLPSPDLLAADADELRYGELGGAFEVQYSYRLFRASGRIYGGDIFIGGGLWGLSRTHREQGRATSAYDLMFDAGLRLDTEVGIFELSLANGVGRLPL